MLARIQELEGKVRKLEKVAIKLDDDTKYVGTKEVKLYIEDLINDAKSEGLKQIVLVSGDIRKLMNLKSRLPIVCNAMRQIMKDDDEILQSPPSGQSSTLKIKYFISK